MKKEADLYLPVKEWLENQGYDVYAEVELGRKRADVIGYNNPGNVVAVEMKTSVSKELIQQAIRWRYYFPYVYIAIPERKKTIPEMALHRLAFHGIGILEVYQLGETYKVKVTQAAPYVKPRRTYRKPWDELLKPEHQTWLPGGSAGGGYVTDYGLSMRKVKDYLAAQYDWKTPREIAEAVPGLHWADPAKQLGKCLMDFEAAEVEAMLIKGRWHFRMKAGGNDD